MRRQPRTMRSTCSAVPARPIASRRSSVSGVATRVSARTLAYDSSPCASAWASRGSVASARATRTFSRAAPRSRPTRQESHSAQERKPLFQPPRASNSRIRSSRRAVAASRCTDSSAISSPRRSSSRTSMASPPSAGATLHRGFDATWKARRRAISRRAPFSRCGYGSTLPRAPIERRGRVCEAWSSRGHCARRMLSRVDSRIHTPFGYRLRDLSCLEAN